MRLSLQTSISISILLANLSRFAAYCRPIDREMMIIPGMRVLNCVINVGISVEKSLFDQTRFVCYISEEYGLVILHFILPIRRPLTVKLVWIGFGRKLNL